MVSLSGGYTMRGAAVRPFRWSFVTLLALGLAACGDEGGPTGPPDPPPLPVIDSARVSAFAGTSEQLMQVLLHTVYGGQHLGTPNIFILPALGATAPALAARSAAACVPVQTGLDINGVLIDSDADGIPDDNTVDYGEGCSQENDGLRFTFRGKYRLRDLGGGFVGWEFTTTGLSAEVRDTLTGAFFRQGVTGVETAHFNTTLATHQMDITYESAGWDGSDSAATRLRTIVGSSYVPTPPAVFQPNATLPQGTLELGATLIFRDLAAGADSERFVLSMPTPVHTSFACDSGIDAGVLLGLFQGDERVGFRFSWPGCVSPVLELFGTTP